MDHAHEDDHHRKPRRRLKVTAVLLTLALLLLVGELLASRLIADKLRRTVEGKLDAQLELGPLVYIPPLGAWTWNPRITRDGQDLFSAASVKLALAQFPLKDKPIVISSLSVHQPVLSIAPGRFDDIKKPEAEQDDTVPKKFSGMLRLKKLRVKDGQVTYVDTTRPDAPPTVWGGLAVDVDTIQRSASRYTYNLYSKAAPLAEVSAAGTIDVDELLLDVHSSTIKLRAEPEPVRSPLPAAVQAFIRKHRINGAVEAKASGKVPLRDPKQSNFSANVAVQNATVALPNGAGGGLDHARATFVTRMSPGGPVRVQVERLDVAAGGRQVILKGGQVELDAARGQWSAADVDGQLVFTPPATNVALAAPPRAPEPKPGPGAQPPQQPADLADKPVIAGKADFTAAASGPFTLNGRNPWEAIRHEVILYPRDASFRPKNFAYRIDGIGGGEIRLQDGMIICQELQAHYGDDLLRLRSARLPVEGLPDLTRWQEISGTVTFHRPVRRYTPKLDKILQALDPDGSFLIAGSWTVDKRVLNAEGKPKNTFDLIISSDTGSFSLTEREIVLERMRGDATVSNAGVDLHELEAQVLGGTLQATGRWMRQEPFEAGRSNYEGETILRNVDLALLEDRLSDEPPADRKPLQGRLFAAAHLGGELTKGATKDENLRAMNASGELEVVRGSLFKMPVIRNIAEQIKGMDGAANVGDGAALFEMANGTIKLRDAAVSSPAVGLQGGGTMTVDGQLDLRVVAAPLADWRENLKSTKIPVVSDVAGELAGGLQKMLNAATGTLLYEFRVGGTVDKMQVIAVPTPVLTDTAAFVFGKMLGPPKKDQRPIELLRQEQRQPPPQGEQPAPRAETR